MTYREEYAKVHGEDRAETAHFRICPSPTMWRNCPETITCNECWDQEIPEEEAKEHE